MAAIGATLGAEDEDVEEGEEAEPAHALGTSVPVRLETVATEIGTLELYCVEKDGPGRWKLEFNVRTEDE